MADPLEVGPFRIIKRLGMGATAVTYLAVDSASDVDSMLLFCIKTPYAKFAHHPVFVEAFENEARMASLLHHPHIVRLHRVERDVYGTAFLAYPFVEGMDLAELIGAVTREGSMLSWPVVVLMTLQIALALEEAHADRRHSSELQPRPPILHRDLCPSNVILGLSGMLYLTDFGLSIAVERASIAPDESRPGRVVYCAPEYLQRRRYDARVDLFSLGVVAFEALTCRRPFTGDHSVDLVHRMTNHIRPRVEQLRPEFHAADGGTAPDGLVRFVKIVDRLLAPNPNERFQSAGEVVDAIEQIAIPTGTRRDLAIAVEEHQPPARASVRAQLAAADAGSPPASRAHMDPPSVVQRREHATYDAERDGLRVTVAGAELLRRAFSTIADRTLEAAFDVTSPELLVPMNVTDPTGPPLRMEPMRSGAGGAASRGDRGLPPLAGQPRGDDDARAPSRDEFVIPSTDPRQRVAAEVASLQLEPRRPSAHVVAPKNRPDAQRADEPARAGSGRLVPLVIALGVGAAIVTALVVVGLLFAGERLGWGPPSSATDRAPVGIDAVDRLAARGDWRGCIRATYDAPRSAEMLGRRMNCAAAAGDDTELAATCAELRANYPGHGMTQACESLARARGAM